jgi:hypothetical protein
LPLLLLLPLSGLAVILSAAKDPDTLHITQTARNLFNHDLTLLSLPLLLG